LGGEEKVMSQMDKQYKSALILVILFAISVAGYFAYQKYGPKDPENMDGENSQKVSMLTNKKEDINHIEIKTVNSDIILVKNNDKFELKDKPKIQMDTVAIGNLLNSLSNLEAMKIISENATNMSDYGLGVPVVSVSYKLAAGDGKTIDIGDKIRERGYYVKISGENKVYMVDKNTGDNLSVDLNYLRNKQVINFKKDEINLVSLIKKTDIAFEAVEDNSKGGKWVLKKPYEFKADDSKMDEIIGIATDLRIKEFIDITNKNLADYGLETPSNTLKIGAKGVEPEKIHIGSVSEGEDEDEGGGRYVMKEGASEIFLLENTETEFTGNTFVDMADKSFGSILSDDITSVEATFGDNKLSITVAQGNEPGDAGDVIKVNNVEIKDKNSYSSFLSALTSISATDIRPDDKPNGSAEISIDITTKSGVDKRSLIKKGDKDYYFAKDGYYTGKIISSEDYNKILSAMQLLKDAK
jgi:hypothetical protein